MSTRQIPVDITYYNLLGVPLEFTDIELKKAYRRKAIEHHPDKNLQDPESAALQFQEVGLLIIRIDLFHFIELY